MAARLIALFTAVTLVTGLTAQTSKPAKPVAWPKPTAKQTSATKALLRKLAEEDEDVVKTAIDGLVEIGPAAANALVRQLQSKNEDVYPHVHTALDRILTPEHAPLVAKWLKKRHLPVRRYSVERLARFRLESMKPVLEKVRTEKDADEQIVFLSSLGLAGLGEWEHFDVVFERCREDWRTVAPLTDEIMTPLRSGDSAKKIVERMRSNDETDIVTGLRLMRSLCPKTHAILIKQRLDSSSNRVKRAAINALRAIVDGDPPLENLSAFQAIPHAKKWKERIQ